MADESPGKVQALCAIFAEKNQPLMGIMPPGIKTSNRPRKCAGDVPELPGIPKEQVNNDQKFQSRLLTKLLPLPPKTSLRTNDNEKTSSKPGLSKPAVGPKPLRLLQTNRTNTSATTQQFTDSCDDSKDITNVTLKPALTNTQSKTVAETIASFMFANGLTHRTNDSPVPESNYTTEDKSPSQEDPVEQSNPTDLSKWNDPEIRDKSKVDVLRDLVNSDNYICKPTCNYRKKELPPLSRLGPPPPKPPRPPHLLLPAKYRQFVTPVPKVLPSSSSTSSTHSATSHQIPLRSAPPKPSHPCPQRPVTPPPLPPTTSSRLSLREEIEELYEDTVLSETRRPPSLIPEFTEEEEIEELYNDADGPPFEEIQKSPPCLPLTGPPPLKPKDPPPACPSEYLQPNVLLAQEEELYQDADEADVDEFYEIMPCDAIVEEPDSPVYSNNKKELEKLRKEEEKRTRKEQKEKEKREKEMEKLKKKFGLNGDEIPIDDGLVKWDSRGGRGDLPVKRGETVLILRMEGNPSGRWLVKNEKGKIGYVELTNIEVDPLSVKSANQVPEGNLCSASTEKSVKWLSKFAACVSACDDDTEDVSYQRK